MPPTDPTTTYWVTLFPEPFAQVVALVGSILLTIACIIPFTLPTRRITAMNKALDAMKRLYHKAMDEHLLDFQLEPDLAIHEQFVALDDQARRLRIDAFGSRTPLALWWWKELAGVFNGHCFAIVKCTWKIGVLKENIQLTGEKRLDDMNMSSTVGLSPAQQVWLRRHRALESES
ncbi:hypothetical protein K438DRAFT_1965858 [Mycena galopus ATCC 62051]|nr:hypothetical protein K438DRAFT_1965858 [Mycena galopus ATCC 62051]